MNVGFDVHGCIDIYAETFRDVGEKLIDEGHRVHIITGQEWEVVKPQVDKFHIPYTHYFSIVDYHKKLGTKMWQDEKKTWWMDGDIWIKSKGHYATAEHIDVHFDDSIEYAKYFPSYCTYVLVPKIGFDKFIYI